VALLGNARRGDVRGALRQRDPEDHVDQDAETAHEHGQHPRQPYERRIEAEPLRDPARDARDHAVRLRSPELWTHTVLPTRVGARITATSRLGTSAPTRSVAATSNPQ